MMALKESIWPVALTGFRKIYRSCVGIGDTDLPRHDLLSG
jgi:hypothetical protein